MHCTIEWNSLTTPEWEKYFTSVPHSTLLQCYDYARAVCALNHQTARWGLIRIEGEEAGLVQLIEVSFFAGGFHALILDRGPLWLEGFGTTEHERAFFEHLNKLFPRRLGRKRRIIPEIDNKESTIDLLRDIGFKKKRKIKPYQTILLDLKRDEETIRAGLKKRWRNALSRSEKKGLSLGIDLEGKTLSEFLQYYAVDRFEKSYKGPSVKLIKALARYFVPKQNFVILQALMKGECIGAILVLIHGKSATYQVGWTTEKGRACLAHNYLLWQAVLYLKNRGITDLDLGGVNNEGARDIKTFKEGLGGQLLELVGQYD